MKTSPGELHFFFDFLKISLHQNTKITPLEVFVDLINLNSKLISVPLTSQINTRILLPQAISRRSHRACSIKKSVFRNFAKLTGKHLCQSFFFNKVAGLMAATLFKTNLWHSCFPVNFLKFIRTPFLQNTSGRLLLHIFFGK